MKKVLLPVLALGLAAAAIAVGFRFWKHDDGSAYRFVELARGDIRSTVSSTGNLQAVLTVQVGTQVSGQISQIFVDYNDHVSANQLMARIDPTLLQQAVRSSEADLTRSRAELAQAEQTLTRTEGLAAQGAATQEALDAARLARDVAQAARTSAEVAVERARQNLTYSEIRSPVDGVVLVRTAEVGQTVAASLSAPQLFLIAGDLSQMEILAAVDESDIGKIHVGQKAEFTVQAYPDETFEGTVRQVRLQSTTLENVVNYTVAVSVVNEEGKLLPGMTATVDFLVSEAKDVFKVPNAALRFRPTEEMIAILREMRAAREASEAGTHGAAGSADSAGAADSTGGRRRGGERMAGDGMAAPGERRVASTGGGGRTAAGEAQRGGGTGTWRSGATDRGVLWHLDATGKPVPLPVRTGLTDGQNTEVTGPGLEEAMQVIAGVTTGSKTASTSPFQSNAAPRFGPPGA